jgi:hypothetical protein
MDSSKPNPIAQALAAQKAAGEHPDADILNAFGEGSLLSREREAVMAHLAACSDCREVVSLSATGQARALEVVAAAAPAAARHAVVAALAGRPTRMKARAWLPLATAACLVMATAVAVYYGQKKREQTATVQQQAPASAQAVPESATTTAMNAPPAAPVPGAAMEQAQRDIKQAQKPAAKDAPALDRASEKKEPVAQPELRGLIAASKPTMTREMTQDALSATNQAVQVEQQKLAQQEAANASVLKQEQDLQSGQLHGQVATAAPRAAAPAFGALAKSARGDFIGKPQWRINEQGRLERTFGSNQWEPALSSEPNRMHVVSVVGGTVWAGGENDVLYRSRDEGATWQKVALPEKNGAQHAIAHIRFENATTGTIEAEDGTQWATTDSGATWK